MRYPKLKPLLLVIALALPAGAAARGLDLHALWDDKCAECHGSSSEFSRKYLSIGGGLLQGRHHRLDLRTFLDNHYPPAGQVDAIYYMLLAETYTPPRFEAECSECHGSAPDFLRDTIEVKEGELVLRKTGQSLPDFLQNHQTLGSEDIAFYMALFTRLAGEIYRP